MKPLFSPATCHHPQRGMTLIEVMVALFIFAFAGVSVMKAVTEHLRGVGVLQELTFATYVANNRMTEVQLDQRWPPRNNLKGSEEMAGATWYWQQTVLETQEKDLLSVEIQVSSDEAGEFVVTSINSFVAKPASGSSP